MFVMIRSMKGGARTREFLSGLSERIILMLFVILQRQSKPGCIRTAYNKVNGVQASEISSYYKTC
jgi:hypothetical protein